MPEPDKSYPNAPKAKNIVKKRIRIPFVWIIPIIAAIAGIWIAAITLLNKGPEITIIFHSAVGLEAQKTKINYNGLDIGVINSISLADDHKSIVTTAQINSSAANLIVEGTKFWVVKPRISGLSITNLSTIISGNYIGMFPGKSKQKATRFQALKMAPLTGKIPGHIFTLKMDELGSIGIGTPVFFRQLKVGQIVSYELDKSGKFLKADFFIQTPYDKYVNSNTRFWQASGIDITMSANGINIKTESLMSILAGGIAFETPYTEQVFASVDKEKIFNLFSDRIKAFMPPAHDPHTYMLVFKQSVRGLVVGAPVQFYGITMGKVTKISPQVNMSKMEVSVLVTISIDPQRYGVKFIKVPENKNNIEANRKMMTALNARGLRAQLSTGNLLTGAQLISLKFVQDAPAVALDWSKTPLELPTIPNAFNSIETHVSDLMANVNKAVIEVRTTMSGAKKLLDNANKIIEPNSVVNSELNRLLLQSNNAARAIWLLADYLERHPESIILGKEGAPKQ